MLNTAAENSGNVRALISPVFRLLILTGGLPAIQFQIQRGAPVNGRDEQGLTPLMLAASAGRAEVCLYFLQNGADPGATTEDNRTASDMARDAGYPDLGAALDLPSSPPFAPAAIEPIALEAAEDNWDAEDDFELVASDPDIISATREAQASLSSARAVPSDAEWQDIAIELPTERDGRYANIAEQIVEIAWTTLKQGYSPDSAASAKIRRLSGASFALDDLGLIIRATPFERALLDASTVSETVQDSDLIDILSEGLNALRVQQSAAELYEAELVQLPAFDRTAEKSMFEALGDAKRRVLRILLDDLPAFSTLLGPPDELDDTDDGTNATDDLQDTVEAMDRDLESILRNVRDGKLKVTIKDLFRADLDLDFVSLVANELRLSKTAPEHADQLEAAATRYLKVRNRVVEANLPLVMRHAPKYMRAGADLEDLIQEGNIGLMRAVERFDVTLGNRFMTYGIWWIRQACGRAAEELRRTVRVPVHVVDRLGNLKNAAKELEYALGREPSVSELSDELEMPLERVVALRRLLPKQVSIETDKVGGRVQHLTTVDQADPFDAAAANDSRRQIASILHTLSPRAERILRCRFGMGEVDEHTLEELGTQMSVTRERIRQVESKALDILAKPGTPRNRRLTALL